MFDVFVLATPILVLGVILVLGFTGCDFDLPPATPARLTLLVRVPSRLTVLRSRFDFVEPGSTFVKTVTDLIRTDDGSGTIVLSFVIDQPASGTWTVTCRLQVSDGTGQAFTDGTGILTFDAGARCSATFEASGSPSTNDLKVVFVGLACEE